MASRKAWPRLRTVSLKRQISTPCWLRKCSSPSFLPLSLYAFQHARHRALHHSFILWRTAIFGHEQYNGLHDRQRTGCTCGEGGDGREEPTSQLHTNFDGEAIEEIRDVLKRAVGSLDVDHQVGDYGIGGRGFDTSGCFLLWLPSSRCGDVVLAAGYWHLGAWVVDRRRCAE